MATFFSYNALVGQRAAGYRSTTFALAELIDNSFDAEATEVTVVFLEKRIDGRRRIDEVLVVDNGKGMNEKELQGALQFGHTTNVDIDLVVQKKKKGKFGFGLPNASLSQCPSIYVYSWTKSNDPPLCVYLDLEELKDAASIDIPPVSLQSFPKHYVDVLPALGKKGTLVSWRKCDRLSHSKAETIIRASKPVIGRVYRHLLGEGRKIFFTVFEYNSTQRKFIQTIERQQIVPNDPLFLMNNTQIASELWAASQGSDVPNSQAAHYKKFSTSQTECKPTNERWSDSCYEFEFEWLGKKYQFQITTSIAQIDIQKPGLREGGTTSIGQVYGQKERDGNISFVRADREIAAGVFGFYNRTVLPHRWWSIEVKFNADSDDLLGVHNNKQGIEFSFTPRQRITDGDNEEFDKYTAALLQAREELWKSLSEKLVNAQKAVYAEVKRRSTKWDSEHISSPGANPTSGPKVPTATTTTDTVIRRVDGARQRQFAPELRAALELRLKEKYPHISPDEIAAAVDALDKAMTRACVLYAPSDSSQLWSFTKVFDFLVVLINTQHEFYSRILSELRSQGQDGATSAIELFISSLAIEEEKLATNDEEKEIVEAFRAQVGLHLNRYIKTLPEDTEVVAVPRASEPGESDE
jgi:hypothetical protein